MRKRFCAVVVLVKSVSLEGMKEMLDQELARQESMLGVLFSLWPLSKVFVVLFVTSVL